MQFILAHRQSKYAAVTLLAWIVDFSLFAAIQGVIGITPALILSRASGGLIGYEAHRRITFENSARRSVGNFALYLVQWIAKVLILIFGVTSIIALTGWHPVLVKLLVEGAVFLASYFIIGLIFRSARHEPIRTGQ